FLDLGKHLPELGAAVVEDRLRQLEQSVLGSGRRTGGEQTLLGKHAGILRGEGNGSHPLIVKTSPVAVSANRLPARQRRGNEEGPEQILRTAPGLITTL